MISIYWIALLNNALTKQGVKSIHHVNTTTKYMASNFERITLKSLNSRPLSSSVSPVFLWSHCTSDRLIYAMLPINVWVISETRRVPQLSALRCRDLSICFTEHKVHAAHVVYLSGEVGGVCVILWLGSLDPKIG